MCVCQRKRKLKCSRAVSVTVPAGYAWIRMQSRRRIAASLCLCAHMWISVCTCHVNDFLLAGFPRGIVATGYHQGEHRSGKPGVPASLRCTQRVFITRPGPKVSPES